MNSFFRTVGLVALTTLSGCTPAPHPIDRYLSQLRPVTVAPLTNANWQPDTLLCPLAPYQHALPIGAPAAGRVNAFLARKQFAGDESYWSLVAVKPGLAGDEGIEHLVFKRGSYDVIMDQRRLGEAAETLPASFQPQTCVPAKQARILAARARSSHRTLISFGTE